MSKKQSKINNCLCNCHPEMMNFCSRCIKLHNQRDERSIIIRDLQASDFENGFFETLSEFRNISGLEYIKASEILKDINKNEFHNVLVAVKNNTVIG